MDPRRPNHEHRRWVKRAVAHTERYYMSEPTERQRRRWLQHRNRNEQKCRMIEHKWRIADGPR